MRFFILFIASLFSLAAFSQVEKVLPAKPNPPRLYNDFTAGRDFITGSQQQALEQKLVNYDDSTSSQFAIVIVGNLGGYSPNEYATALGRKWGVGGSDNNNGLVLLISTGEDGSRREAYIATGYGLEGAIPDVLAKHIIDDELIPYLKEGKGSYYRGLDNTIDALIKAAAGEYKAPEGYGKRKGKATKGVAAFIIIIVIWIVLGLISRGGGGGGMMSRRGYRGWTGPIWIGGGGGGGWSGGGGSSGGFGGFGGGSFGGGGAGSSW